MRLYFYYIIIAYNFEKIYINSKDLLKIIKNFDSDCQCIFVKVHYARSRFLFNLTCRITCRCENALKRCLQTSIFSTLSLLHEKKGKYSSFWIFTFSRKCCIMSARNAIVSRPRMHNGHLFLRTIKLMIDFDAGIGHRCCFFI